MNANTKNVAPSRARLPGSWRCDSKKQYLCLRDAIGAADSYMDRVVITRAPMMPYYCPRHYCWHNGHNSRAPLGQAATYSMDCAARERLRKEIAFLSGVIFDVADSENENHRGFRFR